MVGSIYHNGVFFQVEIVQRLQDLPERVVGMCQIGVVHRHMDASHSGILQFRTRAVMFQWNRAPAGEWH